MWMYETPFVMDKYNLIGGNIMLIISNEQIEKHMKYKTNVDLVVRMFIEKLGIEVNYEEFEKKIYKRYTGFVPEGYSLEESECIDENEANHSYESEDDNCDLEIIYRYTYSNKIYIEYIKRRKSRNCSSLYLGKGKSLCLGILSDKSKSNKYNFNKIMELSEFYLNKLERYTLENKKDIIVNYKKIIGRMIVEDYNHDGPYELDIK